ncbi:MAG: hypothetical protein AVDCRST_MAG76-316 [uncultured Acidimicrobiales bacterium]|uniref:Uncharacterized protein n=1 Tax=uncultured Acidimicrobiales bacterium TaxID=310071 RepID=A0A6J4H6E4_9ACTN|nr:MAG: hypothetical protein AVDCRST_MAG76-316 [uncultured Acidimicrobiales bacterium]
MLLRFLGPPTGLVVPAPTAAGMHHFYNASGEHLRTVTVDSCRTDRLPALAGNLNRQLRSRSGS